MGRKRKSEEAVHRSFKPEPPPKMSPTKKKPRRHHDSSSDDSDMDDHDHQIRFDPSVELDASALPPRDILYKLLDKIEAQLPKEDHVKYDSRVKKLDWEKIKFDELSADDCQKYWYYIQERIRRYRILAELIPDARTWISQPWTNFYKSKDHNRHPDMPKKPLSMYMLYYSEKREEILVENPSLSMPEVAKICSEQYQKLSEKKKARYKMRCDEMRRVYEQKLSDFYAANPQLKPVKAEKVKKVMVMQQPQQQQQQQQQHQQQQVPTIHLPAQPETVYYQQQMIQTGPAPQQPVMVYTSSGQEQMFMMQQAPQPQQLTAYPPTSVMTQVQQPQPPPPPPQLPQQPLPPPAPMPSYPAAPEKPAKPFDLFFKHQMDMHAGEPNFDRQSAAERYRQEWKNMKLKKKAKWIKKAADNFREYDDRVADFCSKNPGYVRPQLKNFLTQEDQRILDKFMGRPEKPPSSAYSLFSKEMLNNIEIKKFPSKERMAQISEKWKILPQEQKDCYQAEVNRSMAVYRQKYEDWFNALSEPEREAETARLNSNKTARKPGVVKVKQDLMKPMMTIQQQQQPPPTQILANLTPVMVPGMAGIQMSQPISVVQTIPIHDAGQVIVQVSTNNGGGNERGMLLNSILQREPQEPARSPKQLFIQDYLAKHRKKKPADAKDIWHNMDKKDKKKWVEKLEPQRQHYIDAYTQFVRGLDKEELEMYTELKQRRDEEEENKRQNESSDSDSETSDSESESESDSDSD